MVNKKFWLGMLVMALTFGMTVVGCGEEEDPLNGTWSDTDGYELKLTNGSFERLFSGVAMQMGNYSTSDSTITLTPSQFNGILLNLPNAGWCNKSKLETELKTAGIWDNDTSPGELDALFLVQTGSYNATTIIITEAGGTRTYTKE